MASSLPNFNIWLHLLLFYTCLPLLTVSSLPKVNGLTNKIYKCDKLLYSEHSNSCQLCSLCDRGNEINHNLECKEKNENVEQNGTYLWCSDSTGRFPECPIFPETVTVDNCSDVCKYRARTFAPGCVCTASCFGLPPTPVKCTQDLTWNVSLPNISVTCSKIGSTVAVTSAVTSAVTAAVTAAVPIIVGCSVVALIIIIICLGIIGVCWCRKKRHVESHPKKARSTSSCVSSPGVLDASDSRSNVPLIRKAEEKPKIHVDFTETVDEKHEQKSKVVPLGTVPSKLIQNHGELDASDSQSIVPLICVTEEKPKDVEETVDEKHELTLNGVPPGTVPSKLIQNHESMESFEAMKALLNSRQDLIVFTRLFDQDYKVAQLTWHNVAMSLLGWNPDEINHKEYVIRPVVSESPGDGPMYRVMQSMHHQHNIGLLELLQWLRKPEQDKYDNAKKAQGILQQFYNSWTAKRPR